MDDSLRPKTGVGVMIWKDDKFLMGKRKNSHGSGEYAFPGGHLEYMEGFAECAKRETLEECNIKIKNIQFQHVSNITHYSPKHYTHIGLIADWESGDPVVLEPEKCESWEWFSMDNLPENIFLQSKMAIESYKTGQNYYDKE